MSRSYEPLVGFDLWITRVGPDGKQLETRSALVEKMILPKSKKEYVVTLKNVKVYVKELHEVDSSIEKVEIIRLSYSGSYNFEKK